MAAFEFIAKHPMNLGGNNQIMRGERFLRVVINISTNVNQFLRPLV